MKADEISAEVVEVAMLAWHRGVEGGDDDCDCLADSDVIDEYREAMRGVLAAAWPLIASLVLADMAAEPAETWHRDALRARALLWLDGEGPDQPAGEARLTDAGWVRETTDLMGSQTATEADGMSSPMTRGELVESGAAIGKRVAELRKARGWSAQTLADRCSALGFPIPRSTIANIETGRKRDVPVQEVAAFAAVLEVAPSALVPALRGAEYEAGRRAGIRDAATAAMELVEAEEDAK